MPRLAYLSGAPRVSTRPESETSGPRSHVLGVIGGLRELGWEVRPYILGDELPAWVSGAGSEGAFAGGGVRTLAADVGRLLARTIVPRQALARTGIDIDYAYERFSPLQAIGRAYQAYGVPWILETNGVLFREASQHRRSLRLISLAQRLEVRAYSECDVLVCSTSRLKQIVVELLEIRADKIIVVPTAVNPAIFDPLQTNPVRLSEGFTIGFVGRLYFWQSLEALFEAVAEVDAEDHTLTNVVVVGAGEAHSSLKQAARELGLDERTHFTGQVSMLDVPAYIAGFDVGYVGPQGLADIGMYFSPVKLTEYLAMQRPVICAGYESVTDIVEDERTGFVFKPGDRASLKHAIRRARRSAARLPQMGNTARQAVLARHTWRIRMDVMAAAIRRVLESRSPGSTEW